MRISEGTDMREHVSGTANVGEFGGVRETHNFTKHVGSWIL